MSTQRESFLNISENRSTTMVNTTGNELITTLRTAMDDVTTILSGNDTICGVLPWTGWQFDFKNSWLHVFDFALFGVVLLMLCVFGFVGNILSIIVLRRCVVETAVTFYLIALAICDNVSILSLFVSAFSIGFKSVVDIDFLCGHMYPYIKTYNIYFLRATQASVGFLTCAVTITRYFTIAYPWSAPRFATSRLSFWVSIILVVLSLAISITILLRTGIGLCFDNATQSFVEYRYITSIMSISVSNAESLAHTIITVYLPWVVVALFNCLLVYRLCVARKTRRSMTTDAHSDHTNKTTFLLLCLTISYMTLYFPALIDYNVKIIQSSSYRYNVCSTPFYMGEVRMGVFFKVLKLLNSCINIIFYCMFGSNFRQGLWKLFNKRE